LTSNPSDVLALSLAILEPVFHHADSQASIISKQIFWKSINQYPEEIATWMPYCISIQPVRRGLKKKLKADSVFNGFERAESVIFGTASHAP
jgi:hypothetical protein